MSDQSDKLDRATLLRIEALRAASAIVAGISSGQRSVVIDGESVNAFDPFEEVVGYAKTLEAYLDGKEKETSA